MADKSLAVRMHYEGMAVSEIAAALAMTEAEVKKEISKHWKKQRF